MARTIPDPTEHIPGSSKTAGASTGKVAYGEDHSRPDGVHSRFLKTAGAIPLKPDIP